MKLKEISIQGFRSFDSRQTFSFEDEGFFYITGKNEKEPSLGANGVGKSTIFEAVCWCLYGKLSTNIKAGNVKNWYSKKECKVSLLFNKNKIEYSLVRTYKPNKLELQNNIVSQEELEKLLGLNFQSFLFGVFVSQFSQKFFDLSPTNKLDVFSQTLDLEKWIVYSDRAKNESERIKNESDKIETTINQLRGELKALREIDYSLEISRWEEQNNNNIKKEKANKIEAEQALYKKQNELDSEIKHGETLKKEYEVYETVKQNDTTLLNEIIEKQHEINQRIQKITFTIDVYKKEIKNLSSLESVCPTCKQKVDKEHLEKEKQSIIQQEKKSNVLLKEVQKEYEDNSKKKDKQVERVERSNEYIKKAKNSMMENTYIVSSIKKEIKYIEDKIKSITKNIQRYLNETNPYKKSVQDNETKKKNLLSDIKNKKKERSKLEQEFESISYWKKGFKDIRLYIINTAIEELQFYINNNLEELGLHNWSIELMVDRETKSNTISKGFVVMVKSPINSELVPFECWSGGEAQRLKLAGTLAMSDFIRKRTGEDWNIEVFDEPTAWLGKEGIDDVLEVLLQRSKENKRSIYIIDHRDFENFGGFTKEYKIIKSLTGSLI